MDRTQFLKTILQGEGHHALLIINGETKSKIQKFYTTVEDLEQAAVYFDGKGRDVYYSVAGFKDHSSREAVNARDVSAFFVDLDVGETKPYDTQAEAVTDLKRFCKELKLPKPLLVNSGRGVHAYWVLREPISPERWLPTATALKAATVQHNLKVDPAVTADLARVLRIPGTHNYKDTPPKDISVLNGATYDRVDPDKFNALLPDVDTPAHPPAEVRVVEGAQDSALMAILSGNTQSRFKTILQKSLASEGCEQLMLIASDQANIDEPMWRAGLSIAQHCADRDKAVHGISCKHPQYDYDETEAKSRRTKGPYLCERFDDFNPGVCGNCQHWGKIKSPIVLGREIVEATADDMTRAEPTEAEKQVSKIEFQISGVHEIPAFPKPYFRGKNGGVYIRKMGDDGDKEEEMIYHNDLYVVKRISDPDLGESCVMRLHLPKDGLREFTMPLTCIMAKEKGKELLAKHGVAAVKIEKLMTYVATWINELQAQSVAEDARRQFGWTDGFKSFVIGKKEYTADGVYVNHPSAATAQFFPYFEPKGTMDGWKEVMGFYNRPGMELHQLVICSAFGSPLISFIPGVKAAGLHLYSSDSGFGKTTALYAAMSIWGKPQSLVLTENDTRNFKMNRGEIYRNIPLYIDEVTNSHPKELSDIAYELTHGQQKGRMQSSNNNERHRSGTWELLSASTGNTSIIEKISAYKKAPRAEAQRILEVRVDEFKFEGKMETDVLTKNLERNYGHAGPVFIQALMSDIPAIEETVASVQNKLDIKLGLTSKNRFWSAWFSSTIAGAIIAKKLGLIDFDINGMIKMAKVIVEENRSNSAEMSISVQEMITQYIYDNKGSILEIRSTVDLRGAHLNNKGLESLVVPNSDPKMKLVGRFETDTLKIFLLPGPFKKWCVDQQVNYNSLIAELKDAGALERVKMRITKGTQLNLPPVNTLMIDCSSFKDLREIAQKANDAQSEEG